MIDIETSPILGYTWGTYDQSVLKILQNTQTISVSWKYLGEEEIFCKCISDYKGYKGGVLDDEKLVKEVWDILDKADVVIAHHGDAFDLKKLNSRFVFHGLTAPSKYETVDTLKVAKKYFAFDGNSLNALGAYLKEGKKIENGGFSLWVDCMAGDKTAWLRMKKYNIQDVVLLERVYLRLRPFMENHPNINAIVEGTENACQTCLSTNTIKRGFSMTRAGRKQRWQCSDCGSWSSGSYERNKKASL